MNANPNLIVRKTTQTKPEVVDELHPKKGSLAHLINDFRGTEQLPTDMCGGPTFAEQLLNSYSLEQVQMILAVVQYGREVYGRNRRTKLSAALKAVRKHYKEKSTCIANITENIPIIYRYIESALAACRRKKVDLNHF